MTMRKIVKTLKWVMFPIIILFTSCNENIEVISPPNDFENESNFTDNRSKDILAEQVAKNLAKGLSSLEVRKFIKEKALDQFDGDYNFLISSAKDNKISFSESGKMNSFSFGDIISRTNPNSSAKTKSSSFLDSLSNIYPLMQVAIPSLTNVNPETWNVEVEIPLVAFVPTNHNRTDIIPAYDQYGEYYELSANQEPNQLTIVISENERLMLFKKQLTDVNGRSQQIYPQIDECPIMQEPYFEDDQYLYYLRSDVFEEVNLCTGGGGGCCYSGGGTGGDSACDRDRKSGKDRLHRMIFNSMSDFKSVNEWFDGGQDIEVTIFFGQANGAVAKVTKVFSGKDSDFKDCGLFDCDPEWFGLNDVEIVTWEKDIYGSAMLYSWVEKDGGSTIELSNSFSSTFENDDGSKSTQTFGIKNTIQDKDDMLGESIVEYCDNTDGDGYTYNTGKIRFQVRQ